MNIEKKTAFIKDINELLHQLDNSVKEENAVKSEIQKAYIRINKPEKVSQQYNEISDSINDMNGEFQQIALKKQYHFSDEQNDLINQLNQKVRKSALQSGIGTINGAVMH